MVTSLFGGVFPAVKPLRNDGVFQHLNLSGRPVRSLEHLALIGQNGGVYLITAAATVWHPQPNDGYQLCKQPPHPRSIFIVFEQQCYISWPPLSTTHTGHSKQKIYSIDPPVSPQLLFPNSHWGQITSALPFHPVTMAEQWPPLTHPPFFPPLTPLSPLLLSLLSLHLPPKWVLDRDMQRGGVITGDGTWRKSKKARLSKWQHFRKQQQLIADHNNFKASRKLPLHVQQLF